MSEKTKKIIYWVLTGLVAFIFLGSAMGKFTADEKALEMAASMGLDANTYKLLGCIEIAQVSLARYFCVHTWGEQLQPIWNMVNLLWRPVLFKHFCGQLLFTDSLN